MCPGDVHVTCADAIQISLNLGLTLVCWLENAFDALKNSMQNVCFVDFWS